MNITTINTSTSLLDHAGCTDREDHILFLPFGRHFSVFSSPIDQTELERYLPLLNSRVQNIWLYRGFADRRPHYTTDSGALQFPQIRISPGLADPPFLPSTPDGKNAQNDTTEPLTYLLVIEGRNGSRDAKVVTADTRGRAAFVMLWEALNGYSTVFSGAVFRRNYERMFGELEEVWRFRQVDDVSEAARVEAEDVTQKTVGVIC